MDIFLQDVISTLPAEVTTNTLHNCCSENVFLKLHNRAAALKDEMETGKISTKHAKPRDPKNLVVEELGTLAWQARKIASKNDHNSNSTNTHSPALTTTIGHCSEALRGQNEAAHRCKFVIERLHDEIIAERILCSPLLEFTQQDSSQCHTLKSQCFEVQLRNAGKTVNITVVVPSLIGTDDSSNAAKTFRVVERELTDAYTRGRESFFLAFFSLFRYFNDLILCAGESFNEVLKGIVAVCGGKSLTANASSSPSSSSPILTCGAITVNGVRVRYGCRPDGKALLGGYVVANPQYSSASLPPSAPQDTKLQFDLLFEGPPVTFTKSSFVLTTRKDSVEMTNIDKFTQFQVRNGDAEMYSYERLASGVQGFARVKNVIKMDDSTLFRFKCFTTHSAMTVARIPLRSLDDLAATLSLVARQVAFNKLFASCFRDYSAKIAVSEAEILEPPQKKAKEEEPTVMKFEIMNINLSEEPYFTMTVKSDPFSVLVNVAKDGVVTAEYNGTNCEILAKMLNLTYNVPFSIYRYMKISHEH